MEKYLFVTLAFLISLVLFAAIGTFALCDVTACMKNRNAHLHEVAMGVALIAAGSIPLLASAFMLYLALRRKIAGLVARKGLWTVTAVFGGLGVYAIVVDPGDALVGALPLFLLCALFALSILNLPSKSSGENAEL